MKSQITAGEMTILDKLNIKKHDLENELKLTDEAIKFFGDHPDFVRLIDFLDKCDMQPLCATGR